MFVSPGGWGGYYIRRLRPFLVVKNLNFNIYIYLFFFFFGGGGTMKLDIFWVGGGGHQEMGLFFGVISKHSRAFFKVNIQNRIFWGGC